MLDPRDRVLLVRFEFPHATVWATPGGGLEEDEDAASAIAPRAAGGSRPRRRDLGPVIWRRDHLFPEPIRWLGQSEVYFLVRTPSFEPAPRLSWAELNAEYVTEIRWWTLEELESGELLFAPRRLPELLRDLLRDGPPDEPVDVGE